MMKHRGINKPSRLEEKFFKYLCKQADYNLSNITWYDNNGVGTPYYVVNIYFKKTFLRSIRDFCYEAGMDSHSKVLRIANGWLKRSKNYILQKYERHDSTNVYYTDYHLVINSLSDANFFYRIPKRTIIKIKHYNCDNLEYSFTPYNSTAEHKLKKEEKEFFRYCCRQADINKSAHSKIDGSYVLYIPDIKDVIDTYCADPKCKTSKNVIRSITHQWKSRVSNKDKTPICYFYDHWDDYRCYILLVESVKCHEIYIKYIPKDVKKKLDTVTIL